MLGRRVIRRLCLGWRLCRRGCREWVEFCADWSGSYLKISDCRFGVLTSDVVAMTDVSVVCKGVGLCTVVTIVHDVSSVVMVDVVGADSSSAGDLSGTAAYGVVNMSVAMADETVHYMCRAVCGVICLSSAVDSFPGSHLDVVMVPGYVVVSACVGVVTAKSEGVGYAVGTAEYSAVCEALARVYSGSML